MLYTLKSHILRLYLNNIVSAMKFWYKIKTLILIIAIGFLLLSSVNATAQPGVTDTGENPPPPPSEPVDTPIDAGLGLLIVAGFAFGVKKIRDHRKACPVA